MPTIYDVINIIKKTWESDPDTYLPPTSTEILSAEIFLGNQLPPSYKVFLELGGMFLSPFGELYLVGDNVIKGRNIINNNHFEREESYSPMPNF